MAKRRHSITLRVSPGDVLFCDDITGKGYGTRAITDMTAAFINRATS
jgi:hypothetical protein